MDPSVQDFLYLNGLVLGLITLYFLVRPRRGGGLRLKLSQKSGAGSSTEPLAKTEGSPVAEAKAINVIFAYKGKDLDAFEVLGVPAGSSLESVESAFHQALREGKADPLLLRAARQAIRSQ